MVKHGTKVKVLLNETTLGFYLKLIGNSILKLQLLLLAAKFFEFTCPWGVNYSWGGKLSHG